MRAPFWPLITLAMALGLAGSAAAQAPTLPANDPLTGPRTRLIKDWVGVRTVPPSTPILVMAGHADSQGMAGSGTPGAAVALAQEAPMDPSMRDELYWNLETARAVVALGQQRGLNIRFYDPPERTIADANDPRTTWSVGRNHVLAGGYALEIHYDAYGPDGFGSGVIPPMLGSISRLDESLAAAFGGYPARFRDGLGAPVRGITILEIGKLEAPLETALRSPNSRNTALQAIAERVVTALELGTQVNPQPDGVGSAPEASNPQANSVGR